MNAVALKIEAVMRQTKRIVHLRVKELAEARNIDERELAGRADVDVRVIHRMWEGQDAGRVLLHQLMRVADVLEVSPCELIQTKDADSSS
jgi:DNA-binding Xre family transcriptional regulator